jgi:hypothetical protein
MKRSSRREKSEAKRERGVLHTRSQYEIDSRKEDPARRSPDVDVIDISKLKDSLRTKKR